MKITSYLLSVWLLLACFAPGIAQVPDARTISTGAASRDNALPQGSDDPNWYVAYGDSLQPGSDFVKAKVVGNCNAILPNPSSFNSDWITYDFGKDCEHQGQGCIDLYFRREIQLPATDDCGVPIEKSYCLNLRLRADNSVYRVTLNGKVVYQYRSNNDPYKYDGVRNPVQLKLCGDWKAGKNILELHTKSCPTIAGLLVEGIPEVVKSTTFLGQDTVLCSGNSLVLKSPYANTLWFDETIGKTKTITKDGTYWASYTDDIGCTVTDSIAVRFGLKSFFPAAFSPNQDGINDCFGPHFSHLDFKVYTLRIFDRYGGMVFQSTDPELCWDGFKGGKPCAEGTYVYVLVFQNGDCAETVIKGDLVLMR